MGKIQMGQIDRLWWTKEFRLDVEDKVLEEQKLDKKQCCGKINKGVGHRRA